MNGTLERQMYVNHSELAPDTDLELAAARLADARSEWARVSSKNRDRMIRRRIDGYNDIRDEYNAAVQEFGRLSLADEVEAAQGDSETLSTLVADYTVQEHLALRQESEQYTDSKKVRKFARKFGEWMNRGNLLTKVGKGVAVGGVVAATVAISPVGAALGAGVALATRAGVSYLRGANHDPSVRDLGDGTLTAEDLMTDPSENTDDLFAHMQQKASDTYKSDNKEVQQKVSKSTRRGLGLAAFTTVLGGTVGMAAHGMLVAPAYAGDELTHEPVGMVNADTHEAGMPFVEPSVDHEPVSFVANHESVGLVADTDHASTSLLETEDHQSVGLTDTPKHEPIGFVKADTAQAPEHEPAALIHEDSSEHSAVGMAVQPVHEPIGFVETDATPDHEAVGFAETDTTPQHEAVGFDDTADHQPAGMTPGSHDHDWSELSHAARYVECGEGGFQTLKEMGVPQEKWEAIWKDAGARLHGHGKTYMMDDGRWGWDHAMRLNDNDLRILTAAAARQGVDL